MTVSELIDYLSQFKGDAPVALLRKDKNALGAVVLEIALDAYGVHPALDGYAANHPQKKAAPGIIVDRKDVHHPRAKGADKGKEALRDLLGALEEIHERNAGDTDAYWVSGNIRFVVMEAARKALDV